VVCPSVTLVSPAKTAGPIEMPFGLRTRVSSRNHVLDGGPDPPIGRGNFQQKRGRPIVKYADTLRSSVRKTAEPIEMPFGLWARVGRRNHVLDGGAAVVRDVAMATNFVTQFAVTGFMGYNFGCMIASDTQFDFRGGFLGSSYPMKT